MAGVVVGYSSPKFPKFTRSLRVNTRLEGIKWNDFDNLDGYENKVVIVEKARKYYDKNSAQKDLTWKKVKSVLEKHVAASKLVILHNYAQKLAMGMGQEMIDETALLLLQMFLKENKMSINHVQELKKHFNEVHTNFVKDILQAVQNIVMDLDYSILEILENPEERKRQMFGSNINFIFSESVDYNENIRPKLKALDEVDSVNVGNDNLVMGIIPKYEEKDGAKCRNYENEYGMAWLENEIRKSLRKEDSDHELESNSLVLRQYGELIYEKLKSNKSSDELQNEFFEMLGCECLEVIQKLIVHRSDIICQHNAELKQEAQNSRPSNSFIAGVSFQDKRNNISKNANESQERRIAKTYPEKGVDGSGLCSFIETWTNIKKHLSYVFNIEETIKKTAAFIAGGTVELPANSEIINTCMSQEVVIPPSVTSYDMDEVKLVKISELNKIGQIVFQGVKELNRIQSIAFEMVYHTNNNILLCAPTGAGKTNVAFLAVTHEIEKHMKGDIIQKDAFKIVYVAPMKALVTEITENFSKRLGPLGLKVRELTGDMQLTKSEMLETQMIVTTPEKWDVVTRKGTDVAMTKLTKLLIIDEVHLLHGDRGPVVEAIVARTLRQVETSQCMIRIVGLSATLPNYLDVADFLKVDHSVGLFFFDSRFRPVPLKQTFIGIKAKKALQRMSHMDDICYNKVTKEIQQGNQVMVFVQSRSGTLRTARTLLQRANSNDELDLFEPKDPAAILSIKNSKLKNKHMAELINYGICCHHAGLLRHDRLAVERLFTEGIIKVLVCTATLAWGVNLPAHTVIIRGTEIYDAKRGSFVQMDQLDVLQIFGRAGRPQYKSSGHGILITNYSNLNHYLSQLVAQCPIESNFIQFLADNLNAEIALGSISNIQEAVKWLSYTYLFVRMRKNPLVYGLTYKDVMDDPNLSQKRIDLIMSAAAKLDLGKMIRYNVNTGDLNITDLGRIASHFYIIYDTIILFNNEMKPVMSNTEIFKLISKAREFKQLKVRDDETDELGELLNRFCNYNVNSDISCVETKINILLQTFISGGRIESSSLISDQNHIIQNSVRIARALFEIAVSQKNALMAARYLVVAKMFEIQMWNFETPLKQFGIFNDDIISKLTKKKLTVEIIKDMSAEELGSFLNYPKIGRRVVEAVHEIPSLLVSVELQPITRTVLRIRVKLVADFKWNDRVHGERSEAFWIWIEEPESNFMYHSEYFLITKKQVIKKLEQELVMTIPITEPPPPQYILRITSDRWMGSEIVETLSFGHLLLPDSHPPHTDLLPLEPLPVTALGNPDYQNLYNFSHFNPIQTQLFHCLYHTDNNVLLGAPTGSGKTVVAEITMFREFRVRPQCKVVYIAPLKALVRERIKDWKFRLNMQLKKNVVELTGDVSPDIQTIHKANVIVTTPEKWDGISRSWQTRNYVKDVSLIIIDEIHLLGEDRGPVLEVIVSRTNFISSCTSRKLRIVGLSTALANAKDLGDWLGIGKMGLYNFRASVRPVPLEVHISGFPGKNYCPRMATMNKPIFLAIRQHSPFQPVLVFVSSRRQTRLTALDLIAHLAFTDNPKQWLHMSGDKMDEIISSLKDSNLKLTLPFGIGMHHAGLIKRDRDIVEELFVNQKIQVLIATATLAWGVNFPAHLVVVKGTEYYDGKTKRYVDMPITDVLQMMGRAGRPQFDEQGVAVILVQDVKKNFYKKFLYEPFPVESSLLKVLPDHLNAEVVAGTIKTKQEGLDYLTWTFFFRRLMKNPAYYNWKGPLEKDISSYLSSVIDETLLTLVKSYCLEVDEDCRTLYCTTIGRIASYYYLSHKTMKMFKESLSSELSLEELLQVLSDATEYSELPVRHNEDFLNGELAKNCPVGVNQYTLDSPNTKALLLFQAHFSRLQMPCSDYLTDLKSVLEQAIRILQAMIDLCAEEGWLVVTLRIQQLMQMVLQASWVQASPLLTLPHMEEYLLPLFRGDINFLQSLPSLQNACRKDNELLLKILQAELSDSKIREIHNTLINFPTLNIGLELTGPDDYVAKIPQPMPQNEWLKIQPNQEYNLSVRMSKFTNNETLAYTPRFPRQADEGWFLNLGCVETKELIALKRVSFARKNCTLQNLTFYSPNSPGRYIYTLYIMSDCYLGLDQQYSFNLEIS